MDSHSILLLIDTTILELLFQKPELLFLQGLQDYYSKQAVKFLRLVEKLYIEKFAIL